MFTLKAVPSDGKDGTFIHIIDGDEDYPESYSETNITWLQALHILRLNYQKFPEVRLIRQKNEYNRKNTAEDVIAGLNEAFTKKYIDNDK